MSAFVPSRGEDLKGQSPMDPRTGRVLPMSPASPSSSTAPRVPTPVRRPISSDTDEIIQLYLKKVELYKEEQKVIHDILDQGYTISRSGIYKKIKVKSEASPLETPKETAHAELSSTGNGVRPLKGAKCCFSWKVLAVLSGTVALVSLIAFAVLFIPSIGASLGTSLLMCKIGFAFSAALFGGVSIGSAIMHYRKTGTSIFTKEKAE